MELWTKQRDTDIVWPHRFTRLCVRRKADSLEGTVDMVVVWQIQEKWRKTNITLWHLYRHD